MYTVILLSVALILVYFSKPKDKQSYHKAILAIFGVAFFVIWKFLAFYIDVFLLGESFKNIAFLLLMTVTVIITVIPWVVQIRKSVAIGLVVFFIISTLVSFALEKNIKNRIAVWGGFFDQTAPVTNNASSETGKKIFNHEAGGFSVSIPKLWQKKINKAGMTYFVWQAEKTKRIEMRPSCFHDTETSMPELIINMLNYDKQQGLGSEKECFIKSGELYTCFITSKGNLDGGVGEKWRWIVMDNNQRQNIELDFIFYSNEPDVRSDATAVINSIKYIPLSDPLPVCASSIEWY